MRLGLLVMLVGITALFRNIGLISSWQLSIVWPIIVLLVGVAIVSRDHCSYHGFGCGKACSAGGDSKCACSCGRCASCEGGSN